MSENASRPVRNDLCVGIDLGTTNSVLATINIRPNGNIVSKVVDLPRAYDMYSVAASEPRLSSRKEPTIPSCVYYRQEKNYEPLVGDFARMQYPMRPHLVAKSIKSQMGKPLAEGLVDDIPDKTPAQISARILQHMLGETRKIYKCDITEAIITVPANFDSAMCKATRDAAELAGIKVRNDDGTERPVLLSEPNAVIYDMINQIHNGEISDQLLDLSVMRRVMVFDLGGGTLDITLHEISRRPDDPDVLKVNEIATNRYTLLGGDDFDEKIAETMFDRYMARYSSTPQAVSVIRQKKDAVMSQLRTFAETLKIDISTKHQEGDNFSTGWGDDEEITVDIGGTISSTGFAYDDTFTQEEVEAILMPFMGKELKKSDFHRLEEITDTRNIIFPILDVLRKASEKMKMDDVPIDAVIVNGGMSKFYMVTDRLTEFFGFEPIVALDPDQSVARGAAVYNYLLRSHQEIKDDMRVIGSVTPAVRPTTGRITRKADVPAVPTPVKPVVQVEWGSTILNDALYLGVRNGGIHEIIPSGAELPYRSATMTGFRIEPGQQMIDIPIKSRNINGTYRTIARGSINFSRHYPDGAYIALEVDMSANKVITMSAWVCTDESGTQKLELGKTNILISNSDTQASGKTKILPRQGSKLVPDAELHTLIQLCQNMWQTNLVYKRSEIAKRVREVQLSIVGAGNPEDFVRPVLNQLQYGNANAEAQMRLLVIARKLASCMESADLRLLEKICMNVLNSALFGIPPAGPKVAVNTQAVYTLSICGTSMSMNRLCSIREKRCFHDACLYAYAKTRTDPDWILACLQKDADMANRRMKSSLQQSSHAAAVALRNEPCLEVTNTMRACAVTILMDVINTGNITQAELSNCIMALGTICDTRSRTAPVNAPSMSLVEQTMNGVEAIYSDKILNGCRRNMSIALSMIRGENLSLMDEQYLLTKLDEGAD